MASTPKPVGTPPDTSGREETYDEWFIRHVEKSVEEASRPDAVWHTHEEVMRDWEQQRLELLAMIANKNN